MKLKDPFGLLAFLHWNHHWNDFHFDDILLPKAVDQLAELGISMIRMDILWSDVEQTDGKFDFSRYDTIVSLLQKKNISILGVLHYNKIRLKDGKEVWNHPPADFNEFANYVFKTVACFKQAIHHWEIWNEPNHPVYWIGPNDGLKKYGELLKLSYMAAKKADPQCIVMNGGITEPVIEDVNNFYKNGSQAYTDVMNIHIFLDPNSPSRLKTFDDLINNIKKMMDNNGDQNKKIWITELGCPGTPSTEPQRSWFGGNPVNEELQAKWIKEIFGEIKKFDFVEKLFWAFYRDTDNELLESACHFGLVRMDLTPKPAFYQLKKLIEDFSVTNGKNN